MIQRVEAGRDLTAASLTQLGRALGDMVQSGVTAVRIDVSRVMEFDSSSLEALVEFDALARNRGLSVSLSGASDVLRLAMTVTGLTERVALESGAVQVAVPADETEGSET